jgi:tRNA(Arg) A34 adenosine deaminase TadA
MSRRNIEANTGGPFGSAVFERFPDGTAKLISVGCNRVVPCNNSTLHGETVAIQMAERNLGMSRKNPIQYAYLVFLTFYCFQPQWFGNQSVNRSPCRLHRLI